MAADSSQHVEMKSAFVDPRHSTFREGKSFTLVKSEENHVSWSNRCDERSAKLKMWRQSSPKTCWQPQRAIFWDHFGVKFETFIVQLKLTYFFYYFFYLPTRHLGAQALVWTCTCNTNNSMNKEQTTTPGTPCPTLYDGCVGSLTSPDSHYSKDTGDGAYGLSSLSDKTRISNHLQMSLQRQHILLSYFKTLSVGPVWGSNPRPPAR